MVIEYSGNVIRSVLTDKRERIYDGKVSERERQTDRQTERIQSLESKVFFGRVQDNSQQKSSCSNLRETPNLLPAP